LEKALNKAEKLADLFSNLHNVINQSKLPNDVKRSLKQNILDIIGNATSYSKALEALQDALNNPNIAEDVKSYIRTILEKVGAVEKQRKATKNENKTQEVEVVEEQEIPLNDDSPKDSQEFVLTKTEDIDLEEQGFVEEELPENDKEPEITNASLENFTLFGNSMLGYMLDKLK
jgi:thymidine phosphorylase